MLQIIHLTLRYSVPDNSPGVKQHGAAVRNKDIATCVPGSLSGVYNILVSLFVLWFLHL